MEDQNKPTVVQEKINKPVKKDTVITWKQVLLIILLIIIALFMFFNFNQVEVNLLVAKIQAPLVVVIILSYLLGSVITWLMQALKKENRQ